MTIKVVYMEENIERKDINKMILWEKIMLLTYLYKKKINRDSVMINGKIKQKKYNDSYTSIMLFIFDFTI